MADKEKLKTWIVFVLLIIVVILTRYQFIDEPLERDITGYAVNANEMLNGKYLYSDLTDHHPPGSYTTFYLFQLFFGFGQFTVFVIGVTFSLLAMTGIYTALSHIDRSAALWAAAFWAIISCDPMIQANQPNAELFMNACLAGAFGFLIRDSGKGSGIKTAIGSGVLIAASSFYKPITVVAAVFFSIGHFISVPGPQQKIRALKQVGVMAFIGFFSWGVVWGYLNFIGIFDDYWKFFFDYSLYYSGNFFLNLFKGLSAEYFIPEKMYALIPLIMLSLVGIVFSSQEKPGRNGILIGFYSLAVALMILLPGQFFSHYYQLWLPVLSIAAGYGLFSLKSQIKNQAEKTMTLLGTVFLGSLIFFQLPNLNIPLDELPVRKYGGDGANFVASKKLAPLINQILAPEEYFFNIGMENGLYFYSKRRPPSGQTWIYYYIDGPLSELLTKRLLTDLKEKPPVLILMTNYIFPKHQIWQWLLDRYQPLSNQNAFAPFTAFSLKGVDLDSRLKVWNSSQN
jgi:hypothetical protein